MQALTQGGAIMGLRPLRSIGCSTGLKFVLFRDLLDTDKPPVTVSNDEWNAQDTNKRVMFMLKHFDTDEMYLSAVDVYLSYQDRGGKDTDVVRLSTDLSAFACGELCISTAYVFTMNDDYLPNKITTVTVNRGKLIGDGSVQYPSVERLNLRSLDVSTENLERLDVRCFPELLNIETKDAMYHHPNAYTYNITNFDLHIDKLCEHVKRIIENSPNVEYIHIEGGPRLAYGELCTCRPDQTQNDYAAANLTSDTSGPDHFDVDNCKSYVDSIKLASVLRKSSSLKLFQCRTIPLHCKGFALIKRTLSANFVLGLLPIIEEFGKDIGSVVAGYYRRRNCLAGYRAKRRTDRNKPRRKIDSNTAKVVVSVS